MDDKRLILLQENDILDKIVSLQHLTQTESIKNRLSQIEAGEIDWPAQIRDLSPTRYVWDELEFQLQASKEKTFIFSLANV